MSRSFKIDRGAFLVILASQGLVDVMLTIRAVILGVPPTLVDIPAEIIALGILCFAGYLTYVAIEFGARFGLVGRILFGAGAAAFASVLHSPLIIMLFNAASTYPKRPVGIFISPASMFSMSMPFLFTGAALIAYSFHRDVMARERQLADAQRMAQDAQLLALRYQINPHFLFNTLNAASTLVLERRNQAAETLLLRLAAFFRMTLTLDPRETISLSREMELQRTYLAIEQTRFSDELRVRIDLPPTLASTQVPALLLQPLVENAVKHTLGGDDGCILIRARAEGGVLILEVVNTIQRRLPPGTGTGLRNVAERLAAEYGDEAALDIDREEDRFRVILTLPLRSPEPQTAGRRVAA